MTSHSWSANELNNFDVQSSEELLAIANRYPTRRLVLRFHRRGCPACDRMAGVWLDVVRRSEYRDVVFVGINVEDVPSLTKHYRIERIPTFVCVENMKPVSGFQGADVIKLRRMIETGRV
jgi:thioredoxin-like negative regulator of GroEL